MRQLQRGFLPRQYLCSERCPPSLRLLCCPGRRRRALPRRPLCRRGLLLLLPLMRFKL